MRDEDEYTPTELFCVLKDTLQLLESIEGKISVDYLRVWIYDNLEEKVKWRTISAKAQKMREE